MSHANAPDDHAETRAQVRRYYGETLARSEDLQTTACCVAEAPKGDLKAMLARLHPETLERFFGCGLIAPEALQGARVLDLGCGAGRDVYVLAQMVGENGFVAGVDMTPEQLAVARAHDEWHRAQFGYARSNVAFHHGLLEALHDTPLAPGSFDVAVSNCVINLVPDKAAALAGVRRMLKPGGEFYFSDVYADRRLPDSVRADPILYGECLGGALAWRDFLEMADVAGFAAPRLVSSAPIDATTDVVRAKLGEAQFISATYRLYALEEAPAAGATATYRGGLSEGDRFEFDVDTAFEVGVPTPVDPVAAAILAQSRLCAHFELSPLLGSAVATPQRSPFEVAAASTATASACCG